MGKRGNGEGTIRKRESDGRWEGRLFLGFENGKRKVRYFYGKTRREVQEQLVQGQHDLQQGMPVESSKWNVEAYLRHWLENVVKPRVKVRTWLGYEQYVRLYLIPQLGSLRLTKLSAQHIQAMNASLLERLSPRTVRHVDTILKNVLNEAVKANLVGRNVGALVDSPRVKRVEITPLNATQVRTLLAVAKGDQLECLYVLAVCTGLRAGELFGLRWADVDLEKRRIQVRNALTRRKGPWQLTEPKSATSRRSISLPLQAIATLREHRKRQLEDRLAADRWEDNDLVFCTRLGTPLLLANVHRRSFKPLLEKAGLPNIRFHDLRHTAASLLLWQGEHPKVVQEMLGHSSIALTMDTYSHLIEGMQRSVADKMERVLAGTPDA